MLILTLTISAFDPEDGNSPFTVSGDYSAVFPLLVVSVFVSLMASRGLVFYNTQRSRGDISAVPEVLCEPGMEGRPMVVDYDNRSRDSSRVNAPSDEDGLGPDAPNGAPIQNRNVRIIDEEITPNDIELNFAAEQQKFPFESVVSDKKDDFFDSTDASNSDRPGHQPRLSSARLDELLGRPVDTNTTKVPQGPHQRHRHTRSALPRLEDSLEPNGGAKEMQPPRPVAFNRERSNSNGSGSGYLVRVSSFGKIDDEQPSLLDQARMRSASSSYESRHRRVNSVGGGGRFPGLPSGRHSRKSSASSVEFANDAVFQGGGALSMDDIAQSFNNVANKRSAFQGGMWTENSSARSSARSSPAPR